MDKDINVLSGKHVPLAESLLGLGATILRVLQDGPMDLDALWRNLQQEKALRRRINGSVTLDTVVLAIDFLFLIEAVKLNEAGEVCYAVA